MVCPQGKPCHEPRALWAPASEQPHLTPSEYARQCRITKVSQSTRLCSCKHGTGHADMDTENRERAAVYRAARPNRAVRTISQYGYNQQSPAKAST